METERDREVDGRVLDHPVLTVRAEERDAVVNRDAAFEIETRREAVSEPKTCANLVVGFVREDEHRVDAQLEVPGVNGLG